MEITSLGVTFLKFRIAYKRTGPFQRLPDGRFYGVSNTKPGGGRNPLCICVSKDGENFDQGFVLRDEFFEMKFAGLAKLGLYGYPHTFVKDGYMYVIYSKNKEGIEVTKFALDQI